MVGELSQGLAVIKHEQEYMEVRERIHRMSEWVFSTHEPSLLIWLSTVLLVCCHGFLSLQSMTTQTLVLCGGPCLRPSCSLPWPLDRFTTSRDSLKSKELSSPQELGYHSHAIDHFFEITLCSNYALPRGIVKFWSMETNVGEKRVLAQFKSEDGVLMGTPFDLPITVTQESLGVLCNAVLENVRDYQGKVLIEA